MKSAPGGTVSERGSMRHGLPGHALGVVEAVADGVLVARERLLEQGDPRQPLHVLHAVPARHHQSQREAVLGQRHAVHLPGEQRVLGVRDRQGALVVLRLAALDAAVETGEEHLDHAVRQPHGLLERLARAACRPTRPCRPPR